MSKRAGLGSEFGLDTMIKEIRSRVDHPSTIRELMRVLSVSKEHRSCFRRQISKLVDTGDLIRIRGNRYGLSERMGLIVGRLVVNPRGFGFVKPENGDSAEDVFVAVDHLNEAMHGDRVAVRVERRTGRPEGGVVRVLDRANAHLVGRYELDNTGMGFVVPFDARVTADVRIPDGANLAAASGQMVAVEILRWPTKGRGPVGKVTEVLGHLDDPGVDTKLIIRKYRIPEAHEVSAVVESRKFDQEIKPSDRRGRTDFRRWLTVTIDGENARDFDDAITIESLNNGHHRLGVHIADVSHYVKEGSALDSSAYRRGTSVYFPERALHMFPAELATGLCSLNPGVERLVQTCVMEVGRNGELVHYEFHDGVIQSDARMTYKEVDAILTAKDPVIKDQYTELVPMFEMMEEVARRLKARRVNRGSIDFDLKGTHLVLDEIGLVEDIVAAERNVAHRIVEEFMLVANETVARHLENGEWAALFRIHEPPDQDKVADFDAFAATLGQRLSVTPDRVKPRDFQRLLKRLKGKPAERSVAMLVLQTMQKARYADANIGHFGLAADYYTHFTSPIRRYPDLVVHRLLRRSREEIPSEEHGCGPTGGLAEVASHSSAMERRAEEAEREIIHWKKVRFMANKVGEEFSGYVTGVTSFGLFIELVEPFVEGLVHISTMADDYYRFHDTEWLLRGDATGKTYRLGDPVFVRIVRVDSARRQIDLGLVEILDAVRSAERQRKGMTGNGHRRRKKSTTGKSHARRKRSRG